MTAVLTQERDVEPMKVRPTESRSLNELRGPNPMEEMERMAKLRADLITKLHKVNREMAELELHLMLAREDT